MRILRILLTSLVVAAIVAAFLLAASISPTVQTWIAEYLIGDQGTVDSVSARFGHAEIDGLKLNLPGAVLTVPHLEADLPVTTAVRERRLLVKRLVVKDWTLDLTHPAAPASATAPPADATAPAATGPVSPAHRAVAAARIAVGAVLGALGRLRLPCDLSVDNVDLDGIVIVPVAEDGTAAHVHVKITGGGLAAGHEATFDLDGTSDILDPNFAVTTFAIKGQLFATMNTPRTLGRLATKAAVSASGGIFAGGLAVTADVAAARAGHTETYTVDLTTGDERHLAVFKADYPDGAPRLSGTWQLNLRDGDITAFLPSQTLPAFAATGSGQFDTDVGLTAVHATGTLRGTASQLDALASSLGRAGTVAFDASFDASQRGRTLHLDRLEISASAGRLTATARALQPFDVSESSGLPLPSAPANDWAEVSGRGIPADWLPGLVPGFGLAGGAMAGDLVVRLDKGTFALRSTAPVTMAGVDVVRDGRPVARRVDLALAATADYGPAGWHFQAAPLKVGRDGAPLAELGLTVSQEAAADAPITVAGAWTAALAAPAFKEAVPDLRWLGGRSATGDFSAKFGEATELDAKVKVVGRDERHSVATTVHATVDESGRIEFTAPVTFAQGKNSSELAVQGTLIRDETAPFLYLKLSSKDADLAQLRLLGGAAAAAVGLPLGAVAGPGAATVSRDQQPFWGNWTGHLALAFDRFRAGALDFAKFYAAGTVDAHSIKLEEGRAALGSHHIASATGGLAFNGAEGVPYRLKLDLATDPIEIGPYFPGPVAGGDPALEGKCDVAATVEGTGLSLPDLLGHVEEKVRLTAAAGIVRVFKTDVDEALPAEKTSNTDDTLERVGATVGTFLGAQGGIGSGRRKVSPEIQEALNVINNMWEIGVDQMAATAALEPDGTIRLTDLAMTAGDLHVTGSGQIAWVQGKPLRARPLHVEVQLGVRGHLAKLFAAAGLLSDRQDAAGFTLLDRSLEFGGTMAHIDNRAWHKLLVKAAERGAEAGKPKAETGAAQKPK